MIAAQPRQTAPSIQKYGQIIAEDGFTQHPRAVEDYLNTLGICSTAILLLFILSSYRWTAEQEFFPSVRTLAKRCRVSARRINQLTALLCELGLMVKTERFAGKSQLSNYYDIEPLYAKVAAWKNAEVATELGEQEAQADAPFEPVDILEQAAQIVSEQFEEREPRQIRYNVRRLGRRFDQNPHLEWDNFADIIDQARTQTETRRDEPTRTGRAFEKLVPYFFSALDYHLSQMQPAQFVKQQTAQSPQAQKITTQPQTNQQKEQQPSQDRPQQRAQKSDILTERAAARKAAEVAGQRKARPPETLKIRIEAVALTFRDKQVKSSIQRAANLMADAQFDELAMCQLVADAREKASKATNVKNRMPYFFEILKKNVLSTLDNNVQ